MSYGATPARPLPGAYVQTPQGSRYQPIAPRPSFGRSGSGLAQTGITPQSSNQIIQQQGTHYTKIPAESLSLIGRASRTINETLDLELRYPELDTYVGQGISSQYDIHTQASWAPYQKVKMYPIPDKIFEQYNRTQLTSTMGLFADLKHAWITIDSAFYAWDYTHPEPTLIGFEEQQKSITAVRLVTPRTSVFVPSIRRLLVLATTAEMILVGLSHETTPTGGESISLYQTQMSVPIGGLGVKIIEGSVATGRIFFSGTSNNDVYELIYSQEERWFRNRCSKINHVSGGLSAFTPTISFSSKPLQEHPVQMCIDDSRRLLYTLSSTSNIRVFHMKSNDTLELVIRKSLSELLNNIGHMTSPTDLISKETNLVSIAPITAREASKLHLMVTTSTGCRLFMSATSSSGYAITDGANAPASMQVQHVKFPPPDPAGPSPNQQQQTSNQMIGYNSNQGISTSSRSLTRSRTASRYPPGYFFCFVTRSTSVTDVLFMSAPDSGRIARPQEPANLSRYQETGMWLSLGSRAEDIGLSSPPFAATLAPIGFANELAVQFDRPTTEIAILTNTGIHTFRRRRLVDMFAATVKLGGGDEGLEGEMKKLIRLYGRAEAAATALAVACGQGLDVTPDSRVASLIEPDVLERARSAFIEFGGKPAFKDNMLVEQGTPSIDMVSPSPKHDGLALYMSRLVRSLWRSLILRESKNDKGELKVISTVNLPKLRDVQRDITKVKEFLDANKTFIEGLAGPEALGHVSTKQDEIALQAEHRALSSLVKLNENIIEGISFVLTLFDERIEEVVLSLSDETRQRLRVLSYEGLFCSTNGKDVAKELVKAIVNRNIANGSNVETVAEGLRRRCGSFCSADDVIIFKARELLKKAAESRGNTEHSRSLLNESLKLYKQVSKTMSMEQLKWAIDQYVPMQFFAGAIQLALEVARDLDRGNKALTWIQEGRPEQDDRATIFGSRKKCYDLIHQVITSLDEASSKEPDVVDGQPTEVSKRRIEAYDVIDSSEDEVFLTDLYDWYLAQNLPGRLLDIQSPFIITYLQRRASEDVAHADLLWRYYSQANRPHESAGVQLELAKSTFALPLDRRIEYLSRAKANASTYTPGVGRQARQQLLREVSDLLDIANFQDELLQRLKGDVRMPPERKPQIIQELDGEISNLSHLFNSFADRADYYDLCILIYQAADYRNPADIKKTWWNLLQKEHRDAETRGETQPYESIADIVRRLGNRLSLSESTFPIRDLVPMLEGYAFEMQRGVGSSTWVMDLFIDLQVPFDSLFSALETMLYNDEAPFTGPNRRYIAQDMVYIAGKWFLATSRGSGKLFDSDSNALAMISTLETVQSNRFSNDVTEKCQDLRQRIDQHMR